MRISKENIIGIVGGMGPQAGVTLFDSIVCNTIATSDQQHLPVMLMSFPRHIVDRTAFLEGSTSINPAYSIVEVIRKMESAGANIVGIACNTAYAPGIYHVIQEELYKVNSAVSLLHMPIETCRWIKEHFPHARRIGVMSTNGTYKAAIYKNLLHDWGYDVVVPDPVFQDEVIHRMIYDEEFGIKSNGDGIKPAVTSLLEKALDFFSENAADAIVLGCTDLSWAFREKTMKGIPVIDSTEVLAKALIREAVKDNAPAINTESIFSSLPGDQ
jgi:aspartate racemase